jgi:hypothetical protein
MKAWRVGRSRTAVPSKVPPKVTPALFLFRVYLALIHIQFIQIEYAPNLGRNLGDEGLTPDL